jgi:large subunit ribosomal protein L17
MCIIELVDFNENMLAAKESKAKATKSRRGGKKKTDAPKVAAAPAKEVVKEEAEPAIESEPVNDTPTEVETKE